MNIEELNGELSTKRSTRISPTGKWIAGITGKIIYYRNYLRYYILYIIHFIGGIAIGITVICAPFISPALRRFCLPYVPATNEQISNILSALKGRTGNVLDLGSGDGRIVLGMLYITNILDIWN